MLTETRPIGDLKPYPRNPRTNEKAIAAVAESIQQFGFRQPIVVDADNVIVCGHTRWKAAQKLGLAEVPVHVAKDLTPEQIRAYRIADNKTNELATWNMELLPIELAELQDTVDWSKLGFVGDEAERIIHPDGKPGLCDPDDAPPVPAEPIAKLGDLWALGNHRLLCGDSARTEDIRRLMGESKACCVFTDPPYGVSIGAKNRLLNSVQKAERCLEDIQSDSLSPAALKAQLLPIFVLLRERIMAEDCTLFVSAPQGGELGMMMMMMMQEACLPTRHVLIWKKNQPTFSLGRLDYDYAHEPILLTWGKRHKRPMLGQHRTSVWEIDRERKCADHPTMKPVALYVNAYANNSEAGDVVADVFAGSGTAFIAAEQLGRKCYGMEISPAYCDVIVQRWEKFTGKKAERA